MLHVIFENELGRVEMSGQSNRGHNLIINEIDGLGLPSREYNNTAYAYQAGQEEIYRKDLSRIITISFDAYTQQRRIEKIQHIFYNDGWLTFNANGKKRKIWAKLNDAAEPLRLTKGLSNIVIQFICDNPYFQDITDTNINVFERVDHITDPFVIPTTGLIFTSRNNEANLSNMGQLDIEPIFYMTTRKIGIGDNLNGILMENITTGAKLQLNFPLLDNDVITIDIKNRTIMSQKSGIIINYISDDTFLNRFILQKGDNLIRITNLNDLFEIIGTAEYSNKWLECIYVK